MTSSSGMRQWMPSRRLLLGTALAVGLIFLLVRSFGHREATVVLIDPLEANNLHSRIAMQQGYFRAHGLEVSLVDTSAGKFAMDALVAGAANYAVVVEMNVAQAAIENDDFVILAELATPGTALKFISHSDSGVATAADLRGKRVGVLFGVSIHRFVLNYLSAHGLSPDDVLLVNLRPPEAVSAFASGDVDAIAIWEPHVARLHDRLGDDAINVLTDESAKYWTYRMVLVTSRRRIRENPSEARAVLSAFIEADEFLHDNPHEATLAMAKMLDVNSDTARKFLNEIKFEVKLDDDLIIYLQSNQQWLAETFYFDKGPLQLVPADTLVSPVLREVAPSRWFIQ